MSSLPNTSYGHPSYSLDDVAISTLCSTTVMVSVVTCKETTRCVDRFYAMRYSKDV